MHRYWILSVATPNKNRGRNVTSAEAEDIEILTGLGLSLSEAKVFFILHELEAAVASTISERSGIAREFVYRILPKLMEKGLVEATITVPKKFKAISMKDACTILLRRKEEENRKLWSKAMKAMEKHKNKKRSKAAIDFQTSLVPSQEAPDARIGQEYENVQKTIDLTFPIGKFLQWSQYYAETGLKEIIKRKVKMRIITQKHLFEIFKAYPKLFTRSFKSQLEYIDFRYVKKPFSVEMMIFDKKTLFVSTTNESDINKMVWLRTNNPLILEMANDYFEGMWEKATKSTV
jgi:sugar-specific transcriptional regulator TrmB